MAQEVITSININATPEKVWSILTDFKSYPNWNPFIKTIQGKLTVGEKILVKICPPNGNAVSFKPKVVDYKVQQKISWLGKFLVKGLFDGLHSFELIDNKNNSTTFIQKETFKGLLIPLLKNTIHIKTKNGFTLMNEKLKKLAES